MEKPPKPRSLLRDLFKANVSQQAIATYCKVGQTTVSDAASGKTADPRFLFMWRLIELHRRVQGGWRPEPPTPKPRARKRPPAMKAAAAPKPKTKRRRPPNPYRGLSVPQFAVGTPQ